MKQLFYGLMAVNLFLGMAVQGNGQPTYAFTTLEVPGSSWLDNNGISANGINASGQIVGYYTDANYRSHGFLFNQGIYTTLDVPGAVHTVACGINDSGQIVGNSSRGAFLLDQGSYTTLRVPGADGTWAYGINATGQIVGSILRRWPQIPRLPVR
jgi:probable HAF family extracellular repeat protein